MIERLDKRVIFHNVFNDGCNFFGFVHCEHPSSHRIAYAFLAKEGENHTMIYELGIEDQFFSIKIEPSGGGLFDAKTEEYLRGSIHYKNAYDEIIETVANKLHRLRHC